ncbi:hypothetical protein CPC735_043830 [Coccidioides posadasii C735 delta SOWgp]|uniref:Small ribosomal subunit protein mS29 n=2 Tax=Coccidioides posadasii TaxID=199306 RepID=A0A0J6FHA2_COCPO|nr:hypothetical protein CPC735_043830 [Coccidioides posadasii C735 delta SOWgp]EER25939.1 hypothetical protein CPC735_043830 [Coccidioides posadasii C735 delta SOWgp]KMM69663.1 hypothetical protein CPAG_05977 [Coccidioides posadasii RMSCC 3488]|eukprot:XP_003068084.1 hypothetical protein CPC735_043830 [Coccidioides posadasii C735 delta SOWgp]
MASSFCWGCLSKLRPSPKSLLPVTAIPRAAATAPFHSTAFTYALPPKKSRSQDAGPKFREARSARVKKRSTAIKPARESPAERKAHTHRLVLSNANALEVTGLQDLSVENMVDAKLQGQVVGVPMSLIDNLRALQAFKTSQGWGMFRRPGTLMRRETLELASLMAEIREKEKGKAAAKLVTGDRFAGKSVHLLQAMTMGLLDKWVVMSVPDARDLVNGTTAYAPLPGSNPTQYVQKNAAAQLLERIAQANKDVLSKLFISRQHSQLASVFHPNMSLLELATTGSQQAELAWPAFQALWSELTVTKPAEAAEGFKPFALRPPVLITIDGISHWMQDTKYFNAEYEPIHAHDLTFVNHFLSLASSPAISMPNGGLVLYATSTSNNPAIHTFDLGIKQLSARCSGVNPTSSAFPLPGPYEKLDARVSSFFNEAKGLGLVNLGGLSKDETRGLLEYYALSGIMRERITESLVAEKWGLSGGGVIGELERMGKRMRVMPAA